MKKKFAAMFATFAMACLLCMPTLAFAEGAFDNAGPASSTEIDAAGNVFAAAGSTSTLSDKDVQRDLYWAGQTLNLGNSKVGGSILAAGSDIVLNNVTTQGSVRVAGSTISLTGVKTENNLTLAGQSVAINAGTSAAAVYACGQDITFAGNATTVNLAGQNVTLSGNVQGDVSIDADSVVVASTAVVTGTLNVTSGNEPSIEDGAQVGAVNYSASADNSDTAEQVAGLGVFSSVAFTLFSLIAHIILVLLFLWILRGSIEDARAMTTKQKLGPILVIGAVTFIIAPVILIVLCCLVVTLPVAFLLGMLMILVWCFSIPFAGAAIGQAAFKKMNPTLAAILMTVIITLLTVVPFLGVFIPVATTIYTTGFFLRRFWESNRARKLQNGQHVAAAAPAPVNASAPADGSVPTPPAPPRSDQDQ